METEELKIGWTKIEDKLIKKKKTFFNTFFAKNLRFFSVVSFIFRIIGVTFFLIIFEISFFFLFSKIGTEFYEIWILQVSVLFAYILFIYGTLNSGRSKVLKFFKIISSLFMLVIIAGLFLLVLIMFESLTTLKLILGVLTGYYIINTILFIKSNKLTVSEKIKLKTLAILGLISFSFTGITFFIALTPRSIEINPKTEPEIIFWAGSNQLPDDPEILDMCKVYNIAFMPTIRDKDVGNQEYMNTYKNIIAHEINLYFVIGGNSEFFAHIDNAKEFRFIYKNISQWFIREGIMNSPFVKSFSIDAESPEEYTDSIHNKGLLKTFNYGYENYPTKKEISKATEVLKEFTELIKNDGKESGMIQGSRFLDNADRDGDVSLFMRNIYSLPIEWDFTVTMLYRTNRFIYDESEDEPPDFLIKSVSIFYDALIEGTKFTTSELSFYQNIALEENSDDDLAKDHYIFIGNFKKEFEDTKYIKENQYFKDFDICRHFKNDKVFFYDLKGFLSHYGWEGVEELGKYAKQNKKSYLEYSTYHSLAFLTFFCGLIIVDIFISIEMDLA